MGIGHAQSEQGPASQGQQHQGDGQRRANQRRPCQRGEQADCSEKKQHQVPAPRQAFQARASILTLALGRRRQSRKRGASTGNGVHVWDTYSGSFEIVNNLCGPSFVGDYKVESAEEHIASLTTGWREKVYLGTSHSVIGRRLVILWQIMGRRNGNSIRQKIRK
jgi:hypothetical protein